MCFSKDLSGDSDENILGVKISLNINEVMISAIKMESFIKNCMDGEIQIIFLKLIKQHTGIFSNQKMGNLRDSSLQELTSAPNFLVISNMLQITS